MLFVLLYKLGVVAFYVLRTSWRLLRLVATVQVLILGPVVLFLILLPLLFERRPQAELSQDAAVTWQEGLWR
jgi:hypothetical protein